MPKLAFAGVLLVLSTNSSGQTIQPPLTSLLVCSESKTNDDNNIYFTLADNTNTRVVKVYPDMSAGEKCNAIENLAREYNLETKRVRENKILVLSEINYISHPGKSYIPPRFCIEIENISFSNATEISGLPFEEKIDYKPWWMKEENSYPFYYRIWRSTEVIYIFMLINKCVVDVETEPISMLLQNKLPD
ncbi:hypothetical protein [Pseudoduganella albidiflava]|uniref:Uncharacterized protein n=1 Tax=Pseudoduganella albidiflava TaxID=321983 RepID=A0A411WXI9_9BURK|nr:hypothetical protein [Pseudoduganella albidiflava]QBI01413.1 hypothetical protein EYF70_11535 [Pseudoduganella albidiflava]GGY35858.1 hypothetical protein GCM10007387_17640 [Pseudoduganella albidiflava]